MLLPKGYSPLAAHSYAPLLFVRLQQVVHVRRLCQVKKMVVTFGKDKSRIQAILEKQLPILVPKLFSLELISDVDRDVALNTTIDSSTRAASLVDAIEKKIVSYQDLLLFVHILLSSRIDSPADRAFIEGLPRTTSIDVDNSISRRHSFSGMSLFPAHRRQASDPTTLKLADVSATLYSPDEVDAAKTFLWKLSGTGEVPSTQHMSVAHAHAHRVNTGHRSRPKLFGSSDLQTEFEVSGTGKVLPSCQPTEKVDTDVCWQESTRKLISPGLLPTEPELRPFGLSGSMSTMDLWCQPYSWTYSYNIDPRSTAHLPPLQPLSPSQPSPPSPILPPSFVYGGVRLNRLSSRYHLLDSSSMYDDEEKFLGNIEFSAHKSSSNIDCEGAILRCEGAQLRIPHYSIEKPVHVCLQACISGPFSPPDGVELVI